MWGFLFVPQVYINYGAKDNHHLLLHYGFVIPENAADMVMIGPDAFMSESEEEERNKAVGVVQRRMEFMYVCADVLAICGCAGLRAPRTARSCTDRIGQCQIQYWMLLTRKTTTTHKCVCFSTTGYSLINV